VHPIWKNICRRKTDLFSYQIAYQFVGLVKTLSPLRPQGEVEPWNFPFVARAIIASASADIDHAEDIALEVVVPNYSIYGRTPTVSEVFACLRVGVWHYTHKTHKDSHKTWVCVSAFCAYKIHKAHKSRHKTKFTPDLAHPFRIVDGNAKPIERRPLACIEGSKTPPHDVEDTNHRVSSKLRAPEIRKRRTKVQKKRNT
jgi:hypothetical protein